MARSSTGFMVHLVRWAWDSRVFERFEKGASSCGLMNVPPHTLWSALFKDMLVSLIAFPQVPWGCSLTLPATDAVLSHLPSS